jgi:GDP-L-fucose synthase
MDSAARIYVAGADTIVGRAIGRQLRELGFTNVNRNGEPNLRDRGEVRDFFARSRPDYVFVTAGRTAGIAGNQQAPADLMIDNLLVAAHVIPAAAEQGVAKLLYLASSCTYPKLAPQPLHVDSLWTGAVEPTSAAYAVAKLAGMTLCDAYRRQHAARFVAAIGADVYGPGDDFSAENSHVVAALIRRFHEARVAGASQVAIWGSGTPRREFVHADDLADACVFAMRHYDEPLPLNLGTGTATSIEELAREIAAIVGFTGALTFDRAKPDGMPFKGLDSSRLHEMGWRPRIALAQGLRSTYEWFLAELARRPARAVT